MERASSCCQTQFICAAESTFVRKEDTMCEKGNGCSKPPVENCIKCGANTCSKHGKWIGDRGNEHWACHDCINAS